MRFLADMGVSQRGVEWLRATGSDTVCVPFARRSPADILRDVLELEDQIAAQARKLLANTPGDAV